MATTQEKSLPLAIGLNLLLPGLGYMYMGRILLGIIACLLIVAIMFTSAGLFLTTWLAMNIIMAIDMLILFNKNKQRVLAETTKKCPRCAEVIQKDAKVCRFCNADLEKIGA